MADDEQHNKSHKGKTVGNKATKKEEHRKRKAGIELEPNRGRNVKAFQGPSKGSRKAQKFFRSVEKKETVMHMPTMDGTLSHILSEPPLLVAVVGPPGVGKTTFIRSMVKFYSGRNLQCVRGPITVIAGKSRRVTFFECPNDLKAMCDLAKVVDYVFLLIDGSYSFEMETFEFLSIAQVHGMPKMSGVVTHLDLLKTTKALKKRRKFLRHRFWHEVAAGAKVMCLAPMIRGLYRPSDVLNVHRLLICIQPKIQQWRHTHSCVVVDRHEDITDPDATAANPNMPRTIAFYGYTRGKPMKPGQFLHIAGLGDFEVEHLARQIDPCHSEFAGSAATAGKSTGHRMRHLSMKQKKLYAPYCDVGGISYDEDAIYVHEDPEMKQIERSGEGVELLRQLQVAPPMDASKMSLEVVKRRPVVFANEDSMDVLVEDLEKSSGDDSGSEEDDEVEEEEEDEEVFSRLLHSTASDSDAEDAARPGEDDSNSSSSGGADLIPRGYNDVDSVKELMPTYMWEAEMIQRIKNLFVTGNWNSGSTKDGRNIGEEGHEDRDEETDKGYESEDDEFEAAIRGETPGKGKNTSRVSTSGDEEEEGEEDESVRDTLTDSFLSNARSSRSHPAAVDALASVGYSSRGGQGNPGSPTIHSISTLSGTSSGKRSQKGVQRPSEFEQAFAGAANLMGNYHEGEEKSDSDDYDILAESETEFGARKKGDLADEELNHLVAGFLLNDHLQHDAGEKGGDSLGGVNNFSDMVFSPESHGRTREERESALESAAVVQGVELSKQQERLMQKKMAQKKLFDEHYDAGDIDELNVHKNMTHSGYYKKVEEVEEKKKRMESALQEIGDDIDRQVQLVGYFSGLYVRFVIKNIPAEFIQMFNPAEPLLAGGLNAGETEHQLVLARVKRHRWYPKILKSQDPLLISMGWRRFQTQPIFATEDPNGRCRYLKYTPLHMHCLTSFYAPVTPPNTGFLALPIRNHRVPGFRIPCTGYTIGNDTNTSIVKKLKLTGTPAKIEKTTAFIKGMFSSDLEAAKFIGAKLRCVSGIRGIIKAVPKGKNGLVRATFEDKVFPSDIVFIRSWIPVDPPRYCAVQRNLVDREWVGMRTMRELRWEYGVPLPENKDSEYHEIKRRHRVADEEEDYNEQKVMLSRNVRLALPFEMKEEYIPLKQTTELRERITAATTVAPEARERRRQALLDALEDKADAMQKKRDAAKKRGREKASRAAEKEAEEYLRGLKKAKKDTARQSEFRSQHKARAH